MKFSLLMLAVSTATLLSGCSASDQEVPTPLSASMPAAFAINTHGDGDVAASREAMDVLMNVEARAAMTPRSSLADAEAGAQAALATSDGLSERGASELRQTLASTMIQRHLAAPAPNMEAVGRYTQMLLEEDSPNAHLLARSLPALEPSWGEARVDAAAERTVAQATRYLSETCTSCNVAALRRGKEPLGEAGAESVSEAGRAIQDGIGALKAL